MRSLFVPARELGLEKSNVEAEAWWRFGSANNWTGQRTGQPSLAMTKDWWAWTTAYADQATTTLRLWRNPSVWDEPARWPAHGNQPFIDVPWNPAWQPGLGTDRGILIHAEDGVWSILNVRRPNWLETPAINLRQWWTGHWARVADWDYLCDGVGFNTPANAGQLEGCGAGKIPKHVGVLTARQARDGIPSALSLVAFNTQMGPGAKFRAPGTRVEFPTARSRAGHPNALKHLPLGPDARTLPMGTRLVLDRPISQWVATKPAHLQRAAKTIGTAIADYGIVVKESGDGDTQIETEGTFNPESAEIWASLGLKTSTDFAHLLDGLITGPADLRVVKEAM